MIHAQKKSEDRRRRYCARRSSKKRVASWYGRVESSMNQEGLVRAVKVKLGSRNPQKGSHAKCSVVERPVQKVVLLMEGVG